MAASLRCGTPLLAQPTDSIAQADEQRQAAAAAALGQLSSFYYDGWTAQIPDNAGSPHALAQPPASVQRFDAVQFRWVGGDNWTDNPTVRVERQTAAGWAPYADQSGEIQTTLDNPAASSGDAGLSGLLGEQANNRAGMQEWHWRASFEIFDSYPRADVPGGQVPNGIYRFVVDGHIHTGGEAKSYHLASDPFAVSPWTGITPRDLRRNGDIVSFSVGPIAYPRTPATTTGFRFYKDNPNPRIVCTTCAFRPWASTGTVASAYLEVVRQGKARHVTATFDPATGRWAANIPAWSGKQIVRLPAGAVRDSYGETNATTLTL
jgi:hypothetical protein